MSGASVVRPAEGPWLLFYEAGGAIGIAVSDDGVAWNKAAVPALLANGAEEGATLGAPAAVMIDAMVRLYYQAGTRGDLWAADAPLAELGSGTPAAWIRLDGDPVTAARDPLIAADRVQTRLGRTCAVSSVTPIGRRRHDLFLSTAATPGVATSVAAIRAASSFDGLHFAVGSQPIMAPPDARSPTVAPWRGGFLLLFTAKHAMRDGIAAALSP